MGYGFDLKCAECDYGLRVYIGAGFRYSPQAVFYGNSADPNKDWQGLQLDSADSADREQPMLLALSRDQQTFDRAYSLIRAGARPKGRYGLSLYLCQQCGGLFNRFFFRLKTGGGLYEPDYWCPDCQKLLEQVDFDHNSTELALVAMDDRSDLEWHCPHCGGSRLLREGNRFLWN